MEVTPEKSFSVSINATESEINELVKTVDSVYMTYLETEKDMNSIVPLLAFKDILVSSIHNTKG